MTRLFNNSIIGKTKEELKIMRTYENYQAVEIHELI